MTQFYKQTKLENGLRMMFGTCLMMLVTVLATGTTSAQDLFFSEYIEGSGQNKAFEIYNPTGAEVDLGDYIVLGNFNGNPFNDTLRFPAGTMIAAGDVYVVAHEAADSVIAAAADSLIEDPFAAGTSFIAVFNGDDVRGLFKIAGTDTTMIDIIGVEEVDPGSGWDVAGVTNATQDHTLLRKVSVTSGNTDFLAGAGTNETDSEWIVLDNNDLSNIGSATPPFFLPAPPYEVGDNIVGNGSFEAFALGAITEGSLNWSVNITAGTPAAAAAFEIVDAAQDDDSRALQITNGAFNGGDDWNIEAVNEPYDVVEGETYRASIWLKADTDTRVARFYWGLPASGNWARYNETDVTLSTEWTKYSIVYTATATDVANRMRFATSMNFAENANGTIWIDNLTITKLPDPVKVTFNVNTATMPDTLQPWHVLQVRGGTSGSDVSGTGLGSTITWDSGTLNTTNVGGDYWTTTFNMSAGDTLNYKFWAGIDGDTPLINGGEQGWESGDNNQFILPAEAVGDTTVPLQWYETRQAPFESEEDSVTLFFRVNVGQLTQIEAFDRENDKVGIRGGGAFFTTDWGSGDILSEGAETGNNLFYEGAVRAQKDSAANIGEVFYKFVIEKANGSVTWESDPNRSVTIPTADSTIHFDFFDRIAPSNATVVNTNLNFEVNVGILEGLGLFNSSIDTVHVTGTFNDWNNTANRLIFNDVSGNYEGLNIPLTTTVESTVAYKYYIKWDASRDNAESENYFPLISSTDDGWEEPGVTGGGDRILTIIEDDNQPVQSDFFNGVSPKALMTPSNVAGGAIDVTFRIDMSPALEHSIPFVPESDSVFLSVETPFFALTNDLPTYSDDIATRSLEQRDRVMFTDEDEDMIYELTLPIQLPTLNHIGFNVVYGEPTTPDGTITQTGPAGTAAGRRFYQYVTPMVAEDLSVSWPSSFTFPVLTWQSTALPYELPPDYTQVSSSAETEDLAKVYKLDQNYPNPFNPATNISFSLPNAADVNLTVYNMLGQRVATLISGRTMSQGVHSVSFDASSLASGIYIYRLEAGSFVSNKRMTLIK